MEKSKLIKMKSESWKYHNSGCRRKLLCSVSEVSEYHNCDKMFLISTITRNDRRKPVLSKEAEELVEIRRRHFRMSRFPVKCFDGYEMKARR